MTQTDNLPGFYHLSELLFVGSDVFDAHTAAEGVGGGPAAGALLGRGGLCAVLHTG